MWARRDWARSDVMSSDVGEVGCGEVGSSGVSANLPLMVQEWRKREVDRPDAEDRSDRGGDSESARPDPAAQRKARQEQENPGEEQRGEQR